MLVNFQQCLRGPAIPRNNKDRNNGEGEWGDKEEYHSEYDGSMSGHSGVSDEEHELQGQRAPRGQICFIVCNHYLTFIYRLRRQCTEYLSDQARISSSWRWFWVFLRWGGGNCVCFIKELWLWGNLITMNTPVSHTVSEYSDCQCFRAPEPGKQFLVRHFGRTLSYIFSLLKPLMFSSIINRRMGVLVPLIQPCSLHYTTNPQLWQKRMTILMKTLCANVAHVTKIVTNQCPPLKSATMGLYGRIV